MSISKATTNLSTLKINMLTEQMYRDALSGEEIGVNELYMTPFDCGYTINNQTITTTPDFNAAISHVLETNLQSVEGGSY